jgi:hypothetical protein
MLDAETRQTTDAELVEPDVAAEPPVPRQLSTSRRRVVAIVLALAVVDLLWLIFVARGLYGLFAA